MPEDVMGEQLLNQDKIPRDGMSATNIWAYSVGHFNNDLCAAQWFVYLSWYINKVVKLDASTTGLCLLSGQIADGITTPIVGLLSDMLESKRFGKRMPWYYIGSIIVIPCFAGIFTYPGFVNELNEAGEIKNKTFQVAWYITLPALFNIGWASV
jgi:Na+/melibiose symporter-like transporter